MNILFAFIVGLLLLLVGMGLYLPQGNWFRYAMWVLTGTYVLVACVSFVVILMSPIRLLFSDSPSMTPAQHLLDTAKLFVSGVLGLGSMPLSWLLKDKQKKRLSLMAAFLMQLPIFIGLFLVLTEAI